MKQELFNSKTKVEDYQRQPKQLGLYEASHEHDACGVGMLVNIQGGKSHELVESALKVLENMRHRGAERSGQQNRRRRRHYVADTARIHSVAGHSRSREREIRHRPAFPSQRRERPGNHLERHYRRD